MWVSPCLRAPVPRTMRTILTVVFRALITGPLCTHSHTRHERADLEKVDPKFATAITSQLSPDLDVTVTAPYVNDENYWKRVCTEGRKWTNCLISEHGMSWKQLFFERLIPELLESFGVYEGVTRRHEDEFTRPAIDSTNHKWTALYPRLPTKRPDGLPMKERFCRYGQECKAATIAGPSSGLWPALDRCKALVPPNMAHYGESYAWATFRGSGGAAALAAAVAEAAAAAPPSKGAAAAAGGGGGAAAAAAVVPAAQTALETDPDAKCDSNVRARFTGSCVRACVCVWPCVYVYACECGCTYGRVDCSLIVDGDTVCWTSWVLLCCVVLLYFVVRLTLYGCFVLKTITARECVSVCVHAS